MKMPVFISAELPRAKIPGISRIHHFTVAFSPSLSYNKGAGDGASPS